MTLCLMKCHENNPLVTLVTPRPLMAIALGIGCEGGLHFKWKDNWASELPQ